MIEFLEAKDLALFWTVQGEKRTLGGDLGRHDYQGHLEINGAYLLQDSDLGGTTKGIFKPPGSYS